MIWEIAHWSLLITSLGIAFVYFRDLGDVTQAFLKVRRRNMIFAIRHERQMTAVSALCLGAAATLHWGTGAGIGWLFIPAAMGVLLVLAFPWVWLHIGLRNQQGTATYYSTVEAKGYVRPEESVIVIENNGEALAYPDHHIKRPHLASRPEGLGGEDVLMTYCAMSHLGLAYQPSIDGEDLDLEVIAQHGNNLIMKDVTTGEPIQQVYGTRERDGRHGPSMRPWPTFRMSFRGFEKAFPDGQVFLNKPVSFALNPLLNLFDNVIEAIFLWALTPHHHSEALMFETLDVEDDRLPRKTLVWGVSAGNESVAYTEDFVRENGNLINSTVGGRAIVVAYDDAHESLGVFYNDSSAPVSAIDFRGNTDRGPLKRVETVQAGAYWCVWANFFPQTDLNRMPADLSQEAAAAA